MNKLFELPINTLMDVDAFYRECKCGKNELLRKNEGISAAINAIKKGCPSVALQQPRCTGKTEFLLMEAIRLKILQLRSGSARPIILTNTHKDAVIRRIDMILKANDDDMIRSSLFDIIVTRKSCATSSAVELAHIVEDQPNVKFLIDDFEFMDPLFNSLCFYGNGNMPILGKEIPLCCSVLNQSLKFNDPGLVKYIDEIIPRYSDEYLDPSLPVLVRVSSKDMEEFTGRDASLHKMMSDCHILMKTEFYMERP